MRPTPESSASDLRLSASTTVRSRVTGAGRRSSNAETSAVPIPRPCQSSATVTAMSAVAGSSGYCRRWATPTGPSSPSGGSTISTRAICSTPSTLLNKPPDHRVIKFTEHLQKPVLARFARQTAEPVAQHLGIRRQQRPDQRRRAVRQKELSGQHLAAQLSRSHTTRCRSAPCRLHQIASFLAFPIPKDQPLFCFATCGFRQRHILVNTPQRPPVHLRAPGFFFAYRDISMESGRVSAIYRKHSPPGGHGYGGSGWAASRGSLEGIAQRGEHLGPRTYAG